LLPACSLEKRVNKKVMAMFEKAEDEYNDLMSKKNIIEVCPIMYSFLDILKIVLISGQKPFCHLQNDKAKIKKVIEELDEKKKETLKVTWLKVNKSVYESLMTYYISQQMHCPFKCC
jgi:structural maintenance of chromosome 2